MREARRILDLVCVFPEAAKAVAGPESPAEGAIAPPRIKSQSHIQ